MQMKESPLSRAAHNGHLQMVQYLVQQGADVNCLDLVHIAFLHVTQSRLMHAPHVYVMLNSQAVDTAACVNKHSQCTALHILSERV